MSGKSTIEWTSTVWNPTTGCTCVSAGCDHCSAFALHVMRHEAYKLLLLCPAWNGDGMDTSFANRMEQYGEQQQGTELLLCNYPAAFEQQPLWSEEK